MPEVYVDPPQLVTAGHELGDAGDGLRTLRLASENAIAAIRRSNAAPPPALGMIEECWGRYAIALALVDQIILNAGTHTLAAVAHYTYTDRDSADRIGRVGDF